jgi:hypothetical protein
MKPQANIIKELYDREYRWRCVKCGKHLSEEMLLKEKNKNEVNVLSLCCDSPVKLR